MIEVREFLVIDSALTTNPTSDFSVLGWCTMQNRECTVQGLVRGRWETLDLAREIFRAACPTDDCLGFAGHLIPTIYIEGTGTFETLRKSIVAFAPAIKWDIRPVGGHGDNERKAKVLRIGRAVQVFAVEDRLKLGQQIDPRIKQALKAQLLADDNGYKANGHDDLADLLGLIVQVIDFDPPPVTATYEPPQPNLGRGRPNDDDDDNNGGNGGGQLPGTY